MWRLAMWWRGRQGAARGGFHLPARLMGRLLTVSLAATVMSACGSTTTPTTASAGRPVVTSTAAHTPTTAPTKAPPPGGPARRGAGINVEPSYRPWRYLDGPAPESWWCAPPNCAPNVAPVTRIDADLGQAAALGVNFVRVEFPWRFIEPQRGVYDWSRADLIVGEARRFHVPLQPIVVYTPAWAGTPTTAPAPEDFSAFMSALVGRYHSDIHYWELWNEPNLEQYWSADERAYVNDILIPGYQAAKSADRSAQIILGGPNWGSVEWFNNIYALGGGNSFDIISWHEYEPLETVLQSARDVQGVLKAHGQAKKPMWLGEFGLQESGISDNAQAAFLQGVLTANSPIAQADWYTLRDEDAMTCCPPVVSVSGHYGLVARDGVTRKAAFSVLRQLISAGLPLVA